LRLVRGRCLTCVRLRAVTRTGPALVTHRASFIASWFAVLLLCTPRPLAAQQVDEATKAQAKAAFEQGVAEYAAGHYAQARVSFGLAYQIRPHPIVNGNIANCYDKLGKPLQAIATFRRFLDSDAGSPEQRMEVKSAIERLEHDVGRVMLRVTPDGASVTIDQN